MDKLLFIYGPTASGKTSLAIKLAKKYGGEIISADSRQVYKGMDIGTGKDIERSSKFHLWQKEKRTGYRLGYYSVSGVKIWLLDIVDPDSSFSSYQWARLAKKIIKKVSKSSKLPMVVGGSAFYIKTLIDGVSEKQKSPDWPFRKKMEKLETGKLKEMVRKRLPQKWQLMNKSDKNNPRRLIRALELGEAGVKRKGGIWHSQMLALALRLDRSKQRAKINKRVRKRLKSGLLKEISALRKKYSWTDPGLNCFAYKEFESFLKGRADLDVAVDNWFKDEVHYAKRQLNWFAKDGRFFWFDVGRQGSYNQINKLVRKWYSKSNEKDNY